MVSSFPARTCSACLLATALLIAASMPCAAGIFGHSQAVPQWALDAYKTKVPANVGDAAAVILYDEYIETIDANGRAVEREREAIRILKPQGRGNTCGVEVDDNQKNQLLSRLDHRRGREAVHGPGHRLQRGWRYQGSRHALYPQKTRRSSACCRCGRDHPLRIGRADGAMVTEKSGPCRTASRLPSRRSKSICLPAAHTPSRGIASRLFLQSKSAPTTGAGS